eukprot:gene8745-220_t
MGGTVFQSRVFSTRHKLCSPSNGDEPGDAPPATRADAEADAYRVSAVDRRRASTFASPRAVLPEGASSSSARVPRSPCASGAAAPARLDASGAAALANRLPSDLSGMLDQLFSLFEDADTGTMSAHDLRVVLRILGADSSQAQVPHGSADSTITKEEFVQCCLQAMASTDFLPTVYNEFHLFQMASELLPAEAVKTLAESVDPDADSARLVEWLQRSYGNAMSHEDFANLMAATPWGQHVSWVQSEALPKTNTDLALTIDAVSPRPAILSPAMPSVESNNNRGLERAGTRGPKV